MSETVKYRIYKTSIQILFISYVSNSKIYAIKPGKNAILPGIKYSLLTLLLGWWNFSIFSAFKTIKASIVALHINFTGGEDFTKVVSESEYDQKTVWIFNNLSREILRKIDLETLDIIIELLDNQKPISLIESVTYLNHNLKNINIVNLSNNDLQQIFETYTRFSTRVI